MAFCTSSSINWGTSSVSGLDVFVLSGVGTLCLYGDLSVHVIDVSSLCYIVSPDSFLMLIIYFCFINLYRTFLTFAVFCINSFLFLLALVLSFFFTKLLSSAYSTLSLNILLAFCRSSFLFDLNFSFCIFFFVYGFSR